MSDPTKAPPTAADDAEGTDDNSAEAADEEAGTLSAREPRILKRDGTFFVAYKPSGWAIHPTGDPNDIDLVSWFKEHFADDPEVDADGAAPAHRLDRDTSGVVLMSTDRDQLGELGGWFGEGLIRKEYRALVHRWTRKRGTVNRKLKDRRRGKRVAATTRYWKLEEFPRCCLLKVIPETGKRHQIRRHLQGIGHAIVGDDRYPPRKFQPIAGFPGRLWLHAYSLELPDGRVFKAPLPEDLEAHLTLLREIRDA